MQSFEEWGKNLGAGLSGLLLPGARRQSVL